MAITRRSLLSCSALSAAACRRRKPSGYPGYAFIANQGAESLAAVDLSAFAVARMIRVEGRPTDVVADAARSLAFALTPDNGFVHEIRVESLSFSRKAKLGNAAISMRVSPDGGSLYVLCREPRSLVRFSIPEFRVRWRAALSADPVDFDIDRKGELAAVSYGPKPILSLVETASGTAGQPFAATGETGAIRFLSDSKSLLTGNTGDRMLSVYRVSDRQLVTNLPLAVRPDHFCFNSDGGQLFITGQGGDAVVVVYPFYTPYIAETVLAGHAPGAMAATLSPKSSPQYLFVANPASSDVSVLDITKRRVVAVTPVGTDPAHITLTPDDQYALVLNQGSGDLAVLRVASITRAATDFKRARKGPLFMMVPVGTEPVSAAVLPV